MKKLFILIALAFTMFACSNQTENTDKALLSEEVETEDYIAGELFDESEAISAEEFLSLMDGKDSLNVTVAGSIKSCCQKKGCWMKLDLGNDKEMMVRFKDYEFFVPLDSEGKTAILEGKAFYDTISVASLRHYAEDAGKSKEEIEAITEPELKLAFTANGVIVK